MEPLTFISLFAGIGGFDLGFERAGMQCVAQVEKDPFCLKVLAKHWPNVERFEDVKEVGKHNLTAVDVICGGFPCQPHSFAGKRKGAADDRDLWPEYFRIINELRPTWVIGENVSGIRTTILDKVLSDLESVGYTWQTFIIPACAVDAQHRRDRVWIVAYSKRKYASRHYTETSSRIGLDLEQNPLDETKQCKSEHITNSHCTYVAHANGNNKQRRGSTLQVGRFRQPGKVKNNGNTGGAKWAVEPAVGRVANGIPRRVDRLRSLGNAVVPQVAQFIGELVVAANRPFAEELKAK